MSTALHRFTLTKGGRWALRRAAVEKRFRGWEVTRLPGYAWEGEPLSALFALRKAARHYRLVLDYDELDLFDERLAGPAAAFKAALYGADKRKDPAFDLWRRHAHQQPSHARCQLGGWRWWSGEGLTLELCQDLRALAVARYQTAHETLSLPGTRREKPTQPTENA